MLDPEMAAQLKASNPQAFCNVLPAATCSECCPGLSLSLPPLQPTHVLSRFTCLQAADTYVLDPEMAAQLKASNPQAFRNVLGRCLEAAGRGLWQPQEELIEKLRKMYGEMDDELEGV
jgi:hypothetical protein